VNKQENDTLLDGEGPKRKIREKGTHIRTEKSGNPERMEGGGKKRRELRGRQCNEGEKGGIRSEDRKVPPTPRRRYSLKYFC